MKAIDTNVLVRFLTGDHPEQCQKARALVAGHDVFVATTVFLECEWVLRSVYGFAPVAICQALRSFAGLAQVTVENPTLLSQALDRAEAGMDFADALHLAAAAHCNTLVTFDRKFIKAAAGGPVEVTEP